MNKLEVAPNMIYRAATSYVEAQDDFDYIQAILLAGSAIMICEPLLNEQGRKTQAKLRAEGVIKLREARRQIVNKKLQIEWGASPLEQKDKEQIEKDVRFEDRRVYNSLKHAGFYDKIKASDDLDLKNVIGEELDFKSAAEDIIIDAIEDYNSLGCIGGFKVYDLPIEIRKLLSCMGDLEGAID